MEERIMYHLTTYPDRIGNLDSGNVQARTPEASRISVDRLAKRLSEAGFPLERASTPSGVPAWRVGALDGPGLLAAKEKFLEKRFQSLKHAVDALTLEQFATGSPELRNAERLMKDRNADMVCMGSGYDIEGYLLDEAIRRLEPDTVYWLADGTLRIY